MTVANARAASGLNRAALRRDWRVAAAFVFALGGCGRIDLGTPEVEDDPALGDDAPTRPRAIGRFGRFGPRGRGNAPVRAPAWGPASETLPTSLDPAAPAIAADAAVGELLGALDAGLDAGTSAAVDPRPPSCRGATEFCGPRSDDCCMTLPVDGATVALPVDAVGTRAAVTVSGSFLDKYEVTVGRFRAFLADYDAWRALDNPRPGAGGHPRAPGSGFRESQAAALPASAAELEGLIRACGTTPLSTLDLPNTSSRIPVNCVTWLEAAAFCAWDGARLPTFPEWYNAAAAGARDRIYPWGDQPTPSRLYASYGCTDDLDRAECNANYVLPVGSHPSGAGFYRHEDLAGSMTEWLLGGSLDEFARGCSDCVGVTPAPLRFWKGGSWVDPPENLANSFYVLAELKVRLPFLGMRCARDAH